MNLKGTIHKTLPYLLKPLSWLYGAVTMTRNWLFDKNVLPVEEFDVPVVSVGNLTVGAPQDSTCGVYRRYAFHFI